MRSPHLAARAGRWSAQHRKQAILGWIVFVVLATVGGGMIGTTQLKPAEMGNGSSRAADMAVDRAGFRDTSGEQVLLQARTPAATAGLQQAATELAGRLRTVPHVEQISSPFDPGATGAHWDFPDRQPGSAGRERSVEHAFVPPVFGTAQPLHGLSGVIRRLAYRRFSEGRLAHWLLLIVGDRVDAWGSHLRSFASLHPDDPITETGVRAELTADGTARTDRSDRRHQLLDPVVVAGPWVAGGAVMVLGARRVVRALRG